MEEEKLEPVELTLNSKISYIDVRPSYGRAQFQFCPVFKRGKMEKLFIVRAQQPEEERYYVLNLKKLGFKKTSSFSISSWSGTDDPRAWQHFWCEEHKTICFDVYVPNGTDMIEFDYHFGNDLTIRFIKK